MRRAKHAAWLTGLGLFLACLFAAPLHATIRYSVSLARPEEHVFHVAMEIPGVQREVVVRMPAWNALYQVRDFSHHVMQVRATDSSGQGLDIVKLDKQSWRIAGQGTLFIRYDTFWDEPGPFASQLNREHAFFNPAMLLLYIEERRKEDVTMTVGDASPGWRIATPLAANATSAPAGPWEFAASGYDTLVDAPVEAGRFQEFFLPGIEPQVRVVVHGDNWGRGELTRTLTRICSYETELMGGAPYRQYLFLLHIGGGAAGAWGGMEHANSTAIFVPSGESAKGVAAHEFFHLWNVKRIRPQSLDPVDYTREQATRSLWFAEGVTSTLEAFTLVRTGLWSETQFLDDLGEQITELGLRPASRWQSAEEASLDAWFEKYPLHNKPEFSVSYYNKGQILGLLLDILIRDATENRASLDDVLRTMNTDFGEKGRSYRDSEDIRLVIERVSGRSFEDFFRRYVAGAEGLPYKDVLAKAGLELQAKERKRAALGFQVAPGPQAGMTVSSVESKGAAERGGLLEGDQILRWNGQTPPGGLLSWLGGHQPGEPLRLRVRRAAHELELTFPLGEQIEIVRQVAEISKPGPREKMILDGLLRGTTAAGRRDGVGK